MVSGSDVPTTLQAGADGRVINSPLEVAGKTWEVREGADDTPGPAGSRLLELADADLAIWVGGCR